MASVIKVTVYVFLGVGTLNDGSITIANSDCLGSCDEEFGRVLIGKNDVDVELDYSNVNEHIKTAAKLQLAAIEDEYETKRKQLQKTIENGTPQPIPNEF